MKFSREEVVEKVNDAFVSVFEIPRDELIPDREIFKDLGVDSLDVVDLLVELQHRFGVSLRQNKELRNLVTLNDVYDMSQTMLAAAEKQ